MSNQSTSVFPLPSYRGLRTSNIANALMTSIMFFVAGMYMSSAEGKQMVIHTNTDGFETDPSKGRDFREISIHPNNVDLLFTECSTAADLVGDCYVLRYNLNTKQLQRYDVPKGYVYNVAKFSPSGNYVLMSRTPKIAGAEKDSDKVGQAYENSELTMMKSDGTSFKVLSQAKGYKLAPIMSRDETRIAYWRSTLRPSGSKSFSSHFDVWEIDLRNGQDRLYAGPFEFFERSGLQYVSQNEILVGAYGPRAYASPGVIQEYTKRFNDSGVYLIQRNSKKLPDPILIEVEYASYPSLDNGGNIYFSGQRPGVSLFRKTIQGIIDQWEEPRFIALSGLKSPVVASDGSFIAFTHGFAGVHPQEGKSGIGLFNTKTLEWIGVRIPPLQSSKPIAVHSLN